MLRLRFCARAFSSCGKQGPLFIAVRGSLTIAASLVAEHRLQTRRLSSCGSRAQLLCGMWDLPRSRAWTHVPCIGRQILNHCATREARIHLIEVWFSYNKMHLCSVDISVSFDKRIHHVIPLQSRSGMFPSLQKVPSWTPCTKSSPTRAQQPLIHFLSLERELPFSEVM